MPRRSTSRLTMEEVQLRFDQWRQTRRGKARIPDELWTAAGELAREHGVNRVSRVLRLEFNHLKRMAEADRQTTSDNVGKAPAFLELMNPMANSLREYTIELDGPGGALRIHCKGVTATEVAHLSRALWSAAG
jgi:hypothetical protein